MLTQSPAGGPARTAPTEGTGTADDPSAAPRRPGRPREAYVSRYAALARRADEEHLYRRRYGYYWSYFALVLTVFAGTWVAVVLLRDSWFLLVFAALLAVVSAQFGFLSHDAAHRQIFASPRWNEWAARIVSGALAGLSYGWWIHKHNRHHSGPNQVGRDPDIAPGPIAYTPEAAASRSGLAAAFTRRQGLWFFVFLPLEGVNLHVQSVRTLLGRAPVRLRALEATLITLRLGGYVTVLLLLPPGKAVAFVAVHLTLFGVLLGGAFAPNHIGMPIVPADARPDFLERQVLMSRNISGGPLTGFFMGGLNHQIEHHLFPNMPRPALKQARHLVREHCSRHGVTYAETSLVQAYGVIFRYLNAVGPRNGDPFRCPLVTIYR